jgi:hypothetical protein
VTRLNFSAEKGRKESQVLGLAIGAGVGQVTESSTNGKSADKAEAPVVVAAETTEAEPSPEPETLELSPDDFKIGVTILRKQCFGSAGCNVDFRIKPEYLGFTSIPDDVTVEVIYEVRGGEDSPQINTFTITGDTAEFQSEESASTSSSSAKLTAEATEVIVR